MFDLERAIADWRLRMLAAGVKQGDVLNELESHLRDHIQQQTQAGLTAQQAFETAAEQIGDAQALKSEFAKLGRGPAGFLCKSKAFLFLGKWKAFLVFCKLKAFLMGSRRAVLPPLSAFTSNAQQTLELARAEAPRLNHDFIGTEHVLLGLLNSPSAIVSNVMRRLGVQSDAVRDQINTLIGPGLTLPRAAAKIPYTPRATRALALALEEAKELDQSQVSPEHIFLGLIKEGDGVAARVLRNLGVDVNRTRAEIINEMKMRGRAG